MRLHQHIKENSRDFNVSASKDPPSKRLGREYQVCGQLQFIVHASSSVDGQNGPEVVLDDHVNYGCGGLVVDNLWTVPKIAMRVQVSENDGLRATCLSEGVA